MEMVRRKCTAREMVVIKRLLAGGHSYAHMAEMIGRKESGLREIVRHYKLERSEWYYKTGSKYPPEIDKEIQAKLDKWIWGEKLTATAMARRLRIMYPPGLHVTTVCTRIRRLPKATQREYDKNTLRKKRANAERIHLRRRIRESRRHAAEQEENRCV